MKARMTYERLVLAASLRGAEIKRKTLNRCLVVTAEGEQHLAQSVADAFAIVREMPLNINYSTIRR